MKTSSPNVAARTAGLLWLACIVTGMLSFFADSRVIVRGNAAETAAAIVAHASMFRVAFTADFLSGLTYLGVTAILYHLLKPAGRMLSFTAALFGTGGIAMGGIAFAAHLTPLVVLSGAPYLNVFTASQLQAAALLALQLRNQVTTVGMLFFGVQILLVGALTARSTFLPRTLGRLLMLGGSSYIVAALAASLRPSVGLSLMSVVMAMALVVEGSMTVWLLTKGVDVSRWLGHELETRVGA